MHRAHRRAPHEGETGGGSATHSFPLAVCLSVVRLWGCGDAEPGPRPDAEPEQTAEAADPKPPFRETGECRRPSLTQIQDDPVVKWAMRDRLRKALASQPYVEEGAWIYQCRAPNPASGGSRHYLDIAMVEGGYRGRTHIEMQDEVYRPHMPGRPECRTVGQFHVHTSASANAADPRGSDVTNAARRGIPSFIIMPEERPRGQPVEFDRPIPYADWSEPGIENLSWTCECEADSKKAKDAAAAECALRGERYFGRLSAEIGTPEPELLDAGPLEWPRRRAGEQATAIRTDADLLAHVVGETMGFGARLESVEQLEELMAGAFRGPMNLFREPERSLRGPFFGRRQHEVVDRSAVQDAWDGGPVRQGVGFSHIATGAGGRIEGSIESDTRAGVYERSARTRSFAVRFGSRTDGQTTPVPGGSTEGHLGSDGDTEGLYVWGVLVEARRETILRLTLRADARGDAMATGIVVPTVVLTGGALAALPPAAPGRRGGGQMIVATTAARAAAGAGGVGAELERAMAELTPEQRRMIGQAMGGDPSEMLNSMMSQLGGAMGETPDGRIRLPGPPQDRESVLYYVMTVIHFELESRSLEEGRWTGQGSASLAVRLEVEPRDGDPPRELPGLEEVDRVLASPEDPGPVADNGSAREGLSPFTSDELRPAESHPSGPRRLRPFRDDRGR